MFVDRIRALIDRHCLLLRDETGELGKLLAQCDPAAGPIPPERIAVARQACASVAGRGDAIGVDRVGACADQLDQALHDLERREDVEPWDMVRVMALQGQLAAAVDEVDSDQCELFAGCAAPEALALAPLPGGPLR